MGMGGLYIRNRDFGEISLFQIKYLWLIAGREGDWTSMATNGNHVLSSIEFNTDPWKGEFFQLYNNLPFCIPIE